VFESERFLVNEIVVNLLRFSLFSSLYKNFFRTELLITLSVKLHFVFFLASFSMSDATPLCICPCGSTSTKSQSTSSLYHSTSSTISTFSTSDQSPPSSYILTTTTTTTSQSSPLIHHSTSSAIITSSTSDQSSPFSDSLTTAATNTSSASASLSSSVCYCPCSTTSSTSYMSCKYAYRKRLVYSQFAFLWFFKHLIGGYTIDKFK